MKKQAHRLGVTEVDLVVRHLKLESFEEKLLQQALTQIDQLYGIDDVSFDKSSAVLNLAYDASRINIDQIEKLLVEHQITISHDWWTQFKEGYYRFVDKNIKDNANHQPTCCNKVPPAAKKK